MPPVDDEPFLRAICANPADDAPRLVFADWLDEHGETDRARFIRLHIDLARRPDAARIEGHCERLFQANCEKWVAALPGTAALWAEFAVSPVPRPGATHFEVGGEPGLLDTWINCKPDLTDWERGFPGVVIVQGSSDVFLACVELIREFVPVHRLRLMNLDDPDLLIRKLARLPFLRGLRDLILRGNSLSDDSAVALANSPFAAGLRLISVGANGMTDRGARAIAESPYVGGLETLHLLRNRFTGSAQSLLRARFGFRVHC
jgi:uncharacterized protein (TIGR02996 family)